VLQDLGILLMLAAFAAGFLGMLDAIIRRVEKTLGADSDARSRELF
jgi:hypothetical protein